jgi:hypothetical protein
LPFLLPFFLRLRTHGLGGIPQPPFFSSCFFMLAHPLHLSSISPSPFSFISVSFFGFIFLFVCFFMTARTSVTHLRHQILAAQSKSEQSGEF